MVKIASDIPEQVLSLFKDLRWSELSSEDIDAIARVLDLFVANSCSRVSEALLVESNVDMIPQKIVEVLNKVDWSNVGINFFSLMILQRFFEIIGLK